MLSSSGLLVVATGKLNTGFAQPSCCCFTFQKITLMKIINFSKIYYYTTFQDTTLSVTPTLQVWAVTMLILMTMDKYKVQRWGLPLVAGHTHEHDNTVALLTKQGSS